MLYRATCTWQIFIANALLGLGSGVMEAPVIAYVGEIGEPEFRSFLMAYTYIGMTFGSLFVSVLNTFIPWRIVAMVCIFVPIANTVLFCFVSFLYFIIFLWLTNSTSSFRFQNLQYGCFQRIDQKMHWQRSVGYAVGLPMRLPSKNSIHFNDTMNVQNRAYHA